LFNLDGRISEIRRTCVFVGSIEFTLGIRYCNVEKIRETSKSKLIQILIDLPDMNAREALFETLLATSGDFSIETVNHAGLAAVTEGVRLVDEGYSGADINLVCREAAMRPLRILFEKLDSGLVSDGM
jgi:hypothetical protein